MLLSKLRANPEIEINFGLDNIQVPKLPDRE